MSTNDNAAAKATVAGMRPGIAILAFAMLLVPMFNGLLFWTPESAPLSVGMDRLRFFGFAFLAFEVVAIFVAMRGGPVLPRQLAAAPVAVRFGLAAVAAIAFGTAIFAATVPAVALLRTVSWCVHLLFGLSVAAIVASAARVEVLRLAAALAAGSILYIAVVVAYVASRTQPDAIEWIAAMPGYNNVRHMGYYLAATYGLALGLAIIRLPISRHHAGLAGAVALAAAAALCWSGTRGGIAAVVAAVAVQLVAGRGTWRIPLIALTMATLAGGAVLSQVHSVDDASFGIARFEDKSQGGLETASNGRAAIWRDTITAIGVRPLFGHGEGQTSFVVEAALGAYVHPHNVVLQMLLAWGIAGGGIALALVAWAWLRVNAATRRGPDARLPFHLMASTLVAYAFIDGTLFHPQPLMLAALAVGVCLSWKPAVSPAT